VNTVSLKISQSPLDSFNMAVALPIRAEDDDVGLELCNQLLVGGCQITALLLIT
jgi:hypothetical protein